MNRNDFKRYITQALDEMKKEQGDAFDLSKVNLADAYSGAAEPPVRLGESHPSGQDGATLLN